MKIQMPPLTFRLFLSVPLFPGCSSRLCPTSLAYISRYTTQSFAPYLCDRPSVCLSICGQSGGAFHVWTANITDVSLTNVASGTSNGGGVMAMGAGGSITRVQISNAVRFWTAFAWPAGRPAPPLPRLVRCFLLCGLGDVPPGRCSRRLNLCSVMSTRNGPSPIPLHPATHGQ